MKTYTIKAWDIDLSNPAFQEKVKKNLKNALIFSAPALIVFLTQIQSGKSWQEASIALYVWGLNIVLDFLRKLAVESQIKK